MHSIVDYSGDVVGERDRLFPVSQGELYLIFVRMQKLKIAESLNSESQGDPPPLQACALICEHQQHLLLHLAVAATLDPPAALRAAPTEVPSAPEAP